MLDERSDLFAYFRDLVKVRKAFPFLRTAKDAAIERLVRFEDLGDGGLVIEYGDEAALSPNQKFIIMINPTLNDQYFTLDDHMTLVFSDQGYVADRGVMMKDVMIESLSLLAFVK